MKALLFESTFKMGFGDSGLGFEGKPWRAGLFLLLTIPVVLGGCATGKVPPVLRISHIVFMLGGLALLLIAGLFAVPCLFGRKCDRRTWWLACIGFVSIFVGGIPLGMATAYFKYGKAWVWDLTDNKTLAILLYWAVVLLVTRKDRATGPGKAGKRLPWLVATGALATLVLYLLPH